MIYRAVMDGNDIYNSEDKRFMLLQPVLNTELNTAGSFTFTMPPSHYFYDSLRLLTSTVEVYEDGELLWYGRPVEIRTDFLRQKQVYCEGAFSFFNDTVQRPQEYESVFLRTFFQNVIAAHNSQTDISRRFQVGTVTVPNVQVYRKLEYASTFETLKKMCLEAEGGYFFFRKENGVNYIDWLAEMPYTCGQPVEFGLNLLDLNSSLSGADIVTCLLPYADGEEGTLTVTSVNDGSDVIESEAAETYGRITRAVKFDNVTSVSELLALGTEYLENTQFDALTVECSAVELHLRNPGYEQFRVGQTVHCRSVPHLVDRDFPLVKMELRLDNASKQITLGTAKRQALTRIFREDAGNATTEEIGEVKDEIGGQIEEIQQDISDINTRLDAADSAGWKHWYGTANEYNRISNYDARTIYFIRSTENMADYFQYETEETP